MMVATHWTPSASALRHEISKPRLENESSTSRSSGRAAHRMNEIIEDRLVSWILGFLVGFLICFVMTDVEFVEHDEE